MIETFAILLGLAAICIGGYRVVTGKWPTLPRLKKPKP
jgi:hypothetical protein